MKKKMFILLGLASLLLATTGMATAQDAEAPATVDPNSKEGKRAARRAAAIAEAVRRIGVGGDRFDILSMGMTGDFEVAIEEGANCVRIGSAFFGEPPADSAESEDGPDED